MANNNGKKNGKEKKEKPARGWLGLETETKNGILALLFFVLAIISILSYFNLAGVLGEYYIKFARFIFGKGIFLITVALLLGGISLLKSFHKDIYKTTFIGMVLFILSFLGILTVLMNGSKTVESGGYVGYSFSYPFVKLLGIYASLIIFIAFFLCSLLIALDVSLGSLFGFLGLPFRKKQDEETETIDDMEELADGKGVIGQITELGRKILPRPSFKVQTLDEDEEGGEGAHKIELDRDEGSL